jgi:pseudouridine-5'-phosphate glycosidase
MLTQIELSPEVSIAMSVKMPVLALESTLITHGLPYPENLETALAAEQIAREQGVVPATIALMQGKIKIGLSREELTMLANDKQAVKASRRDIAYLLNQGVNAGTTVAATLFCAHAAGIKLFATGGIGGVHRGDGQDISADLIELARTPMAVVCAGAKAILDLPKTLEFLETFSVPVIGYDTDKLPGFYSAFTHYDVPARIDDINELARFLDTHWRLGSSTGVLITNPIPLESEIPSSLIQPAIDKAIALAEENNITGNAMTPFLLAEVAKTTAGRSLQANIHLIKNNVLLAARLAKML